MKQEIEEGSGNTSANYRIRQTQVCTCFQLGVIPHSFQYVVCTWPLLYMHMLQRYLSQLPDQFLAVLWLLSGLVFMEFFSSCSQVALKSLSSLSQVAFKSLSSYSQDALRSLSSHRVQCCVQV